MNRTGETGAYTNHSLEYHLVLVTKQRKTLLSNEVPDRVRDPISEVADEHGVAVQVMNSAKDHLHVRFTALPTTVLGEFISNFKDVTSRRIKSEYPVVKETLSDGLWRPGYFLVTTGQVSLNEVIDYIEHSD